MVACLLFTRRLVCFGECDLPACTQTTKNTAADCRLPACPTTPIVCSRTMKNSQDYCCSERKNEENRASSKQALTHRTALLSRPIELLLRQMNRSGIFQIAFDQDRYGNKSAVKQEPSGQVPSGTEDTDRWIHEQRLQIDHPNFFCGQGDTPPVGLDNCRPRGAWFLHQKSVVQREQDQQQQPVLQPVAPPVAPLVASSRTPYSLSNGGGGHCSGSSGTSPALPQSHVAWGPASFGDASGNLGGNLSNGSGGHSSGSSATSPAPPQSQVAWGPAPLGDDSGNLGGSGIAVAAAAQTSTGAADSAQQELDASDLLDA